MSSNDFMQLLVISSPKFHAKSGKTKKTPWGNPKHYRNVVKFHVELDIGMVGSPVLKRFCISGPH